MSQPFHSLMRNYDRYPAVGAKRKRLSIEEHRANIKKNRQAIAEVDFALWNHTYTPPEIMNERRNTITVRNNNYTEYRHPFSIRKGTIMSTQEPQWPLNRRKVFQMMYATQHSDSHGMVFQSGDFQTVCPCATTERSQFPACQVQLAPESTESVFSSATEVCSGSKAYAVNHHNSMTMSRMIHSFRDPVNKLPKEMLGPFGFAETKNWVGSGSCTHPVNNTAFVDGHPDDNVSYNPQKFVAVVYKKNGAVYSEYSGKEIQTAKQLVFDGGMAIGIGYRTLLSMMQSLLMCFREMDKHPSAQLAASSEVRQEHRIEQENARHNPKETVTLESLNRLFRLA